MVGSEQGRSRVSPICLIMCIWLGAARPPSAANLRRPMLACGLKAPTGPLSTQQDVTSCIKARCSMMCIERMDTYVVHEICHPAMCRHLASHDAHSTVLVCLLMPPYLHCICYGRSVPMWGWQHRRALVVDNQVFVAHCRCSCKPTLRRSNIALQPRWLNLHWQPSVALSAVVAGPFLEGPLLEVWLTGRVCPVPMPTW